MKPKITFRCKNEACAQFDKDVDLRYVPFFSSTKDEHYEDYYTAKLKRCRICHSEGNVKIEHGGQTFSDLDVFGEHTVGIVKEINLLKKLIDRGVANPDEKKQYEEALLFLKDTSCPCCGQSFTNTVDSEVKVKITPAK